MTTIKQKMSGGEAMIRAAMANGTTTVFGIPGIQIYPIFDAIQRLPGIETITSRHEQGAAYMAMGYAKATGRPGVYSVVPGPGVLNTTAALCTAWGCNTPVYCMTGQIPSEFLGSGRGHLHELPDQRATLASLVKWAERIEDPADTQAMTNEAFRHMLSGRPGPVTLEMCWDTMAKNWDVEVGGGYTVEEPVEPDPDAIKEAARLIKESKRIMIMVGGGAQHASTEVLQLAEMLDAPVTSFRSGRGVVSEDHDLGMSSAAAYLLWKETDLLIGVGSRLEMQAMRWGSMMNYNRSLKSGPRLIRIDIDPEEMNRFTPDVGIVTDAAKGLKLLAEKVSLFASPSGEKRDRIAAAKAEARKQIEAVQPQMSYLDVIREVLPRDGFFVGEVCQVGFTSYFGFPTYEPRTYVTEGFQGNLGFGYPTAVGVKAAMPDKAVISVSGDGGFLFGSNEMATAVQHEIGLISIVFNNNAFGNARRDQQQIYDGRVIGTELRNPDLQKYADSFGVVPYRVSSPVELKPALSRAIDDNVPAMIEVICDRDGETSPWPFILRGG
jgi:acetolactate synthase I/II/III large subunit